MQKFTVFSILFSISVILMIGDIGVNNYLQDFSRAAPEILDDTAEPDTTIQPIETPDALPTDETLDETSDANEEVNLSEDESLDATLPIMSPAIQLTLLEEAGFLSPVLKDASYSGLLFQFITFADQSDAFIYQWNLFDGEQYIGSLYEILYPTETGSFQGYLTLRERAASLTTLGEVNEVNNYGDASFYFNHKTKLKTVHMVMRSGNTLYAFEYAQTHHEKMKKLFDILSSTL